MSIRSTIQRTNRSYGGKYASGKNAVGICHRSGFKVPWRELVFEPGTNHLVSIKEDDGLDSLVSHPQNFGPEKRTERIGLRWSFPDTILSVGVVVSAEQLFLPSYASVSGQFIQYAQIYSLVSIGDGASSPSVAPVGGNRLDFSLAANSQYYLVIFQGI